MTKPLKDSLYINVRPFADVLLRIDDGYLPGPNGKDALFHPSKHRDPERARAFARYWGKFTKDGFEIGVRGKIIALCALRATLETQPWPWKRLAEEIISSSKMSKASGGLPRVQASSKALDAAEPERGKIAAAKRNSNPDTRDAGASAKPTASSAEVTGLEDQLVSLIRNTISRQLPPADHADHLLNLVVGYFAVAVASKSAIADLERRADLIFDCLSRPHPAPSHCADALATVLGLPRQGVSESPRTTPKLSRRLKTQAIHHLEPALENYVQMARAKLHGESELNEKVTHVEARLSYPNQHHTPLLVLTGGPHAGKKAVVGDLLASLRYSEGGTLCLTTIDKANQSRDLPIFAINAKKQDYLTLVLEILVFLERYRALAEERLPQTYEATLKQRFEVEGSMGTLTLDNLLQQVAKLHKDRPAMFIIMDVHGSRGDSVLRILRSYGINRLLRTLLQNEHSRILLTDPEGDDDTYEKLVPKIKGPICIPLAPPTINRLRWYAPLIRDEVASVFIDWRPSDLNMPTSGAALIGLSALLLEIPKGGEAIPAAIAAHLEDLRHQPELATERVFEKLLVQYKGLGVLESLALICASEDGLLDLSLKYSLDHWPTELRPKNWLAFPEACIALDRIASQSPFMLLKREGAVHVDREEYAFDEDVKAPLREISRDIAQVIVKAMQSRPEWLGILRVAYRQIAIAARRRAQIKKMRGSVALGITRDAEARDIQSFVALLASINPEPISKERGTESPPPTSWSLRLSSDRVFTASQGFDPRIALRFAVRCLLREDIDRDFRLSMISDQDELRLRLYLLVFCELGIPHDWSIGTLRRDPHLTALPRSIPPHIERTFTDSEILDLLVTVALTGFHSQFPQIIDWAHDMALDLRNHLHDADPASWWCAVTRIRCSMIDMTIQLGTGHQKALSDLGQWMEAPVADFDPTMIDPNDGLLPGLEIVKSWMRLEARRAELHWISSGDETAVTNIYDRLAALEHRLADSIDQDDPIILSGRTARRFVRFLTQDAPVYRRQHLSDPSYESEGKSVRIKSMLEANISRLRRFSGAERVTVLVDMARRHHLAGKRFKALRYAELALETTFSGSSSHGGKIDVLAVNGGIHLYEAEQLVKAGASRAALKPHLGLAREAYTLLGKLADALKFQPARAISSYLAARASYLEYEVETRDGLPANKHAMKAWQSLHEAKDIATSYGGLQVLASMKDLSDLVDGARRRGHASS